MLDSHPPCGGGKALFSGAFGPICSPHHYGEKEAPGEESGAQPDNAEG